MSESGAGGHVCALVHVSAILAAGAHKVGGPAHTVRGDCGASHLDLCDPVASGADSPADGGRGRGRKRNNVLRADIAKLPLLEGVGREAPGQGLAIWIAAIVCLEAGIGVQLWCPGMRMRALRRPSLARAASSGSGDHAAVIRACCIISTAW